MCPIPTDELVKKQVVSPFFALDEDEDPAEDDAKKVSIDEEDEMEEDDEDDMGLDDEGWDVPGDEI